MKHIEPLSSCNATCNGLLFELPTNARRIAQPFSESDIIFLHNIFLTHGSHAIKVPNIATGRAIIKLVLESLHYYSAPACLSLSSLALDNEIFDLSYAMSLAGYISNQTNETCLEEFFLEQLDGDFLWIEATNELLEQTWFGQFMHQLEILKFESQMPVVVLFYEE